METFSLAVLFGFVLPVLVLWPLEQVFPARRGQRLWRQDTPLDLLYWICTPALRGVLLILAVLPALLIGMDRESWYAKGFGPLAQQPDWLQVLEVVLLGDFVVYWLHRWFHGARLWKFHAVHHSSTQLDWLSTMRHHPVNDLAFRVGQALPAVLLGFTPAVLALWLPALAFHAILSHSNVKWTFGIFGYVIVSPAMHAWHHTSQAEGMDKNFGALLSIWDVLFGTYYVPPNRLAEKFGIHDPNFPTSFAGQIVYPFQREPESAPPTV